jgi:imidazolonepropionase-like amidohydrolase
MNTVLKWIGAIVVIVVALVVIILAAAYIYVPDLHKQWVKPGISQRKIPAGVDTSVVFENVTVIPMDSERVLERQTVLVKDNRITYIGPGDELDIPADAHVVDGAGKFLIPGLSDMHMHTFGSENDLLVYLANGVTTIRILGADPPVILEWRDQIKAGTRVGPNIWAWWPMIESHTFDPKWLVEFTTRGGETFVYTPEEAEQLVAKAAAMGVDGIKSHVVFSSDVFQALQESAAKHGLPFDGHVPIDQLECWDCFRSMNVPALAHVEELAKVSGLSDENIRQIAQDAADDGMWVTTTIYLARSITDQASDLEGALNAMPEVKYVHPDIFDTRWGPGANDYVDFDSFISGGLPAREKMLLALYESGTLLMSGTDATLPLMAPGYSLHDELETMVDVGLSPYDVLKTSTYNPALYLGELEEFGTIEEGKRADLVLLEANPLQDITNTRQIAGTMVRGRWYSRADLDHMLEAVAKDYETVETTQTIVRIAFPIVIVLLLVAVMWFVVHRRKASQLLS